MKTIEIDGKSYLIDIEKATEQGLLKEKDNKPRSWKEYIEMAKTATFIPSRDTYASYFDRRDKGKFTYDRFNSSVEAKAFCALGKLIQLRDAWWGEWRPNWDNGGNKYIITTERGNILASFMFVYNSILAFPTEEMRDDFLETFRDLIEQAKMFL